MNSCLHGWPARADARERLRRATYLRIFAVLPQSSMLHQRRLPFLLVSTKRKRQAPHCFTLATGPDRRRSTAAWTTGHKGALRSSQVAQSQPKPPAVRASRA